MKLIPNLALTLLGLLASACGGIKDTNPYLGLGGKSDSTRFGYEVTAQGWTYSTVPSPGSAVSMAQTSLVSFFGNGSLAIGVQDLSNDALARSAAAAVTFSAGSYPDLSSKTITLWIYAPAGVAYDDSNPSYAQIYLKDAGDHFANGPGVNLVRDGWTKVVWSPQANASALPLTLGTAYYAGLFDPASIKELGFKAAASGSAPATFKFNGTLYLDGVDW